MKKITLFSFFIIVNLCFVILQIYKQSTIAELSYQLQKKEKIKRNLLAEQHTLEKQLALLQKQETIKQFAEQQLAMKKIALNQIRRLSDEY